MTEGLKKFEESPEHIDIDRFKNEIKQLAERTNDPHFRKERFNPDLLTRDDFSIYEEYKTGTLDDKKFESWRSKIAPATSSEKKTTKEYFLGYLANKIVSWKLYADRVKSNKDFFKEFTNYVLAGGKIIDFYEGLIKPRKWIRITRTNEKGESEDILPPNIDPNNIIHHKPTLQELRHIRKNIGLGAEVSEISENPSKEIKEDFNRWTGLLEGEG